MIFILDAVLKEKPQTSHISISNDSYTFDIYKKSY